MIYNQMTQKRYLAASAGLYCDTSQLTGRGYTLKCHGFSDTLPKYVASALDALRHIEPDQVRFETQYAELANDYEDSVQGSGGSSGLAASHADRMLYRIAFLPAQLAAALPDLSLSDLTRFSDSAFSDAKAEALVLGNVNRSAAAALANDAVNVMRSTSGTQITSQLAAAPIGSKLSQAVANLQGKWYLHAFSHPNPSETNCAVQLTVQLGLLVRQQAAAAIILGDILAQPFFASLRTDKQLGYIVSGHMSEAHSVYSLSFVVQSSTNTTVQVTDEMHSFLNNTLAVKLANMTSAEFEGYLAAARARLLQKPTSIQDEGETLFARIVDHSFDFKRDHELAKFMGDGSVSLADVRAMYYRALVPPITAAEGGRLLVWVIPHAGAAATAVPTAHSAPAGYSLMSTESFRSSASYYAHVSVDGESGSAKQSTKATTLYAPAPNTAAPPPRRACLHPLDELPTKSTLRHLLGRPSLNWMQQKALGKTRKRC
jgi:secreted Zn-dependent insulinase-like peptidase